MQHLASPAVARPSCQTLGPQNAVEFRRRFAPGANSELLAEFMFSGLMRSRLPASTRNLRRRPSVRQGGGWRTTATVSALKAREASFFASSLRHVVDRKRMQAIPCTQAREPRSVAASALRQLYRAGCQAFKVGELRRQPSAVHSVVGVRSVHSKGWPNPSIEGTSTIRLRLLAAAPSCQRWASQETVWERATFSAR